MTFHPFDTDVSGYRLPRQFTCPFCYTPHPLAELAARHVQEYLSQRTDWAEEIGRGKMFGVMAVRCPDTGKTGFIAAFSGNIAHSACHEYFVPPICDLMSPGSLFRKGEAVISTMNHEIERLQQDHEYAECRHTAEQLRRQAKQETTDYAQIMADHKQKRDATRLVSSDPSVLAGLTHESQFERAEMRRLRQRWDWKIAEADRAVQAFTDRIRNLKEERRARSAALQNELFDAFRVLNAKGEWQGLRRIFEETRHELPPSGTGECAAPKLLQYAYLNRLQPLAMAEFWWGASPKNIIRRHLHYYPACRSKCGPLLTYMLQGLDVEPNPLEEGSSDGCLETVYEDDWLWVVNKPAGMLSVPGKTGGTSVDDIARARFINPPAGQLVTHRLDMHTSGLLIVAKTREAFRYMQRQFADRKVEKCYTALVDGILDIDEGFIALPLTADPDNRPYQTVDHKIGKPAITRFRVITRDKSTGTTRVAFYPLTGRTHQLRVHAAHPEGLDMPIRGDLLYGQADKRLYLHAGEITFTHPATGRRMTITCPAPF